MTTLDFSQNPKQAFKNGFLKGFSLFPPSLEMPKHEAVKMVEVPNVSLEQSLICDWKKIGLDFKNVIRKFNPAH